MSKNMKLQFSHQDYQTRAVQAVVQVFDGQPLAKSDFSLTGLASSVEYASDGSIGNVLKLSDEALLANVQKVQKANGVAVSTELMKSVSDNGKEEFCPLNFTLAMEAWADYHKKNSEHEQTSDLSRAAVLEDFAYALEQLGRQPSEVEKLRKEVAVIRNENAEKGDVHADQTPYATQCSVL